MLCIRNMYPSFIVYSRVTESDGFPMLVSTIIMTNLGKNIYNISQVCGCNPRRLFYWKHFWWNKFLENFFFWKKYCLYYIKSNWSSRFWKINYLWLVFILFLWIQGSSQGMKLQRRFYGIYTVCFLIFTIPWNFKLVSFCTQIIK